MKQYVLAHDLGTTGNKATLYDRDGRLVGSAFYGYETRFEHTGWAEQNPEDWWQAVCNSTQKLLKQSEGVGRNRVHCVQQPDDELRLPLDDGGRCGMQSSGRIERSVEQTNWLGERVSPRDIYRITGHRLSPSYSLPKMLWLRDHQPDVFKATYKFVHAKDSVVARMTGKFVTEPSDASGMNLYDLEKGTWSDTIVQAAGLNTSHSRHSAHR